MATRTTKKTTKASTKKKATTKQGLSVAVLEELTRLGAKLRGSAGNGIDQILRIQLPGDFHGYEMSSVVFGVGADLTSYACCRGRSFECFGEYGGGNYFLLVDTADKRPSDPTIYVLDHDGSEAPSALGRFSEMLRYMRPGRRATADEEW